MISENLKWLLCIFWFLFTTLMIFLRYGNIDNKKKKKKRQMRKKQRDRGINKTL